MGITSIDDNKLVCDICGKTILLSDTYDKSNRNCTQYNTSMYSFNINKLGVIKHSSNVVSYKNGVRTRREMFMQASRKFDSGVICEDCLKNLENASYKTPTKKEEIVSDNDTNAELVKAYTMAVCDEMENLLEEKDITIPNEDREGDPEEARIYGDDYYRLEVNISCLLTKMLKEYNGNK